MSCLNKRKFYHYGLLIKGYFKNTVLLFIACGASTLKGFFFFREKKKKNLQKHKRHLIKSGSRINHYERQIGKVRRGRILYIIVPRCAHLRKMKILFVPHTSASPEGKPDISDWSALGVFFFLSEKSNCCLPRI